MNNGKLSQPNTTQAAIEKVVLYADLTRLTEIERVQYNLALCKSLGLNPLTNPVDYIRSDNKLKPYVNSNGLAQLRRIYGISCTITNKQFDKATNLYSVSVVATDRNGRSEETTAIVTMADKYGRLTGIKLANKMMSCETKAKSRATRALIGLPLDEGDRVQSSKVIDPPLDILPDENFGL